MAGIPTSHADLVGAPHFPHLATANADGTLQSTPIWVARDGDDVLFTTNGRYRKAANMRRDPRVALTVYDQANPYRYLELVGRVELRPRQDYSFLDGLTKQYTGDDEYPYKSNEAEGLMVRLSVDHSFVSDFDPPPSQPMPAGQTDLLGAPHFAHVVTVTPAGQPRSSVVWIKRDGDDVAFWTGGGTTKVRNLRQNPTIALSVHDHGNGYRYVEVRGTAELEPVDNIDLLDELAPLYWQVERYPEGAGDAGVVVRVKVAHQSGMPPAP